MRNDYKSPLDMIPAGIAFLKQHKNLYMHGNGKYAEKCLQILERFNIKINGVVAGSEYIHETRMFQGYDVIATDEFYSNLKKPVSIIAGFFVPQNVDLKESIVNNSYVDTFIILDGCSVLYDTGFVFDTNSKIRYIDSYYDGL